MTAVRDLPDDDPRIAVLVGVLEATGENHKTPARRPEDPDNPPPLDPDETAVMLFERDVRHGLDNLLSKPVPQPVQWTADRYFVAKSSRQLRAQRNRPVPPSIDGQVAEARQRLRQLR